MMRFKGPDITTVTVMFRDLEVDGAGRKKERRVKELYSKLSYLPRMYGYHYRWADNKEDILQEAQMGLWDAMRTFKWRESNNFHMWGERLVRGRVGKEKHRHQTWCERKSSQEPDLQEPDPKVDLHRWCEEKEKYEILDDLLDSLPLKESQMWRERIGFDDGKPKSIRAIAEKHGCSHENTRVVLNKTTAKLTEGYQSYTCQ